MSLKDRGATWALVLGLLSLWFGVFAPLAIVGGALSIRRIRASAGQLSGAGSATAGLVAGLVALIVSVAGILLWIRAA